MSLFLLKGLKSYQPSKYKCLYFPSKTHVTFLLWLITFEPLEQKQTYIPLLKVLMCGMNAWGYQWHGGIFILQYTSLKTVLLLHKIALVNFPMATTVYSISKPQCQSFRSTVRLILSKAILSSYTQFQDDMVRISDHCHYRQSQGTVCVHLTRSLPSSCMS